MKEEKAQGEVKTSKFRYVNRMNKKFLAAVNRLNKKEQDLFFEMEEKLFDESIRATILDMEK